MNTFRTLCQAVVIPKWTYLAFIWGDRVKFKNSDLWAELVTLSTCPKYNPQKELLEVLGNNIPIDIQIESHGAKFYIKNRLQPQEDQVFILLENSKTPIVRRLAADNKMFGSPISYSQDSMKELMYKRWNTRLKNLTFNSTFEVKAKESSILPKHLNKADTSRIVQILTQHSMLGSFQFHICRCFTPICTCMEDEESASHFLYNCKFYSNLRQVYQPKPIEALLSKSSWKNWESTVKFLEASRRFER